MNLHAPQLIYLALVFIGLGLSIAEHGKIATKTQKENFFVTLAANAIFAALLYWGGFFTN